MTFFFCLFIYYYNLAPGITLEDSGEFLTALKFNGTPHPPGYPLYSIIGSFWVNLNPSSIAFMGNLFSALCMSISCLIYYFLLILLTSGHSKTPSTFEYFLASTTSALVATSPHLFRQALITEVYGLHQLLFLLSFYFLLHWYLKKQNTSIYCFFLFSGLAFSNHHIFLSFFIPSLAFILISSYRRSDKINFSLLLKCLFIFLVGLLPYLYLPIQAKNHFYFNWGDPKTLDNFLMTVLRFQYFPHLGRTFHEFVEQIREYFIHLFYNFNIIFTIIAFTGMALIALPQKLKWLLGGAFLFTGPIVSLMINFKIPTEQNTTYFDVANTMSVFFLSSYFFIGIGFYLFWIHFKKTIYANKIACIILSTSLLLFLFYRSKETIIAESKKNDFVAQELFNNLELITKNQKALVITNWDPFSFPSLFYKLVENRFPNIIFFDIELLKGTWYQKSFKIWNPDLESWFENKDSHLEDKIILARKTKNPSDIQVFQKQYHQLIRNVIANAIKNNFKVIALVEPRMFSIPIEINNAFNIHPLPIGYQLYTDATSRIMFSELDKLNMSSAIENKESSDRLIKIIYNFYFFNLMNMTKQSNLESKDIPMKLLDYMSKTFKDDNGKLQVINTLKKEMNL